MTKGIVRSTKAAMDAANREVSSLAKGGRYAAGMASEGYMGGYRDALNDVLLALNGVEPVRWEKWKTLGAGAIRE